MVLVVSLVDIFKFWLNFLLLNSLLFCKLSFVLEEIIIVVDLRKSKEIINWI